MDVDKLVYNTCHNPYKIRLYNGITRAYEIKEVPCGKCYHCKITRINEWVTRMTIQANYSNYVYYGTLTYGSKKLTTYHRECLGLYSDFNENKSKTYTPMVLRYDHIQKFFKRLRKNTGVKFQYAVCGEYGGTYSRPHYHYIIFSKEPISKLQIYKAWSAPSLKDNSKRIVLGRIEHRDIKNNPKILGEDLSSVYKYVCKYIQKSDFDFEQLTNINNHKKVFHYEFAKKTLLSVQHDLYIANKNVQTWEDYKRAFSPFFHCSKKPSLGYEYLQDNLPKFQEGNLRLFGLSSEYIFPTYFRRKIAESLVPLKPKSTTNEGYCSAARLPRMESLLTDILNSFDVGQDTQQIVQLFRYQDRGDKYTLATSRGFEDIEKYSNGRERIVEYSFPSQYLSFKDCNQNIYYEFDYDKYNLYNISTGEFIATNSLEDVLYLIKYYYEQLKQKLLVPLFHKSTVSANQKSSLIEDKGGITEFEEYKTNLISQKLNVINRKQHFYKKSKTFE